MESLKQLISIEQKIQKIKEKSMFVCSFVCLHVLFSLSQVCFLLDINT